MLVFPGGSDGKESACNARDLGSIPRLGRSSGGGHGHPLQCSCLKNSMDRRAWWATFSTWNCKESDTTEWLSTHNYKLLELKAHHYTVYRHSKTVNIHIKLYVNEINNFLKCTYSMKIFIGYWNAVKLLISGQRMPHIHNWLVIRSFVQSILPSLQSAPIFLT